MAMPLVNGQAFSWSNIKFLILGVTVNGIDGITYDDDQEMEDGYGGGNYATRRGVGNITFTGSITLHKEEIVALQRAVATGRLQDIPEFDIIVAYTSPDGKVSTVTLKQVRFKKTPGGANQNDKFISHEIPLQIGNIITV